MVCMERQYSRLPCDSGPKRPGSLWDQPCLNTKVARQSTPTGKTGAEICTSVVWIVNLKRQKVSPKVTETPFLSGFGELERAKGIESSYAAWEAVPHEFKTGASRQAREVHIRSSLHRRIRPERWVTFLVFPLMSKFRRGSGGLYSLPSERRPSLAKRFPRLNPRLNRDFSLGPFLAALEIGEN